MPSDTYILTISDSGVSIPSAHASSHLTGGSDPIPLATASAGGLMSAATYSEHVVNNAKISNKTHTGDVTDNNGELTVNKIKGVDLSSFSNNSVLKVTTGGVIAAATAADYPILNQSTIGNALTATTATKATNIAGGATGSLPYQTANDSTSMLAAGASGTVLKSNGAAAPSWSAVEKSMLSTALAGEITANSNKIGNITHSGDVTDVGGVLTVNKIKNVALDSLGGGILKVAASTGIPSIATAADFPTSTVTAGGTGITSYNVGDILYANSNTTLSKLSGVAEGNVLLSGGVNNGPSYGKVALSGATTHITGTLPVANGGTGVTNSTGSGSNVLSNSPTLITPALGTPSSGNLSSCTGLSLTTGVTGTLPVTSGGTGTTSLNGYVKGTGTGALSASTTIPITDLSGSFTVANGGTGQSTFTAGLLKTTGGTSAFTTISEPVGNIVGTTDTQTLTNKTLVSPVLGTPLSGTLTNCTGLPLTAGVTGVLPVANGGTGLSTVGSGYLKGTGLGGLTEVGSIPTDEITGILSLDKGGTGLDLSVVEDNGVFLKDGGIINLINVLDKEYGGLGVNQTTHGGYYITSTSATSFSTSNTWTKVQGTTSGFGLNNMTHTTAESNRITVTNSADRNVIVTVNGSFTGSANDVIGIAIFCNGNLIASSEVRVTSLGNSPAFVSCQGYQLSSWTDYFEVFVRNISGTASVTFSHLNLFVHDLV